MAGERRRTGVERPNEDLDKRDHRSSIDAAPHVEPSFSTAPSVFSVGRSGQDHHKPGSSDPDT